MRDQEKCPKILISRRRGGLFKYQNNSSFDLQVHQIHAITEVAVRASDRYDETSVD
jgi:hypothetical protein